jgi:hypothetical protein
MDVISLYMILHVLHFLRVAVLPDKAPSRKFVEGSAVSELLIVIYPDIIKSITDFYDTFPD